MHVAEARPQRLAPGAWRQQFNAYTASMQRVNPAAALPWARPAGQLRRGSGPADVLLVRVRKQVLCYHQLPATVIAKAWKLLPRRRRAAADMDADLRSGVLSDYRWLHAELLAGVAEFYQQGIRFTPYVEAALEYASAAVAWSTAAMDLGCKEAEECDADAAAAMEAK
ncbi:hypothetical protein OEZ86_004269 [Tetradesmus obliquus]|nr:hypothetical protein OEZ86_004269 [Tetradesmus obliquus]